MRVSVGQFEPTNVIAENLVDIRALAQKTAADSSALLVLTDEAMLSMGSLPKNLEEFVNTGWPEFVSGIQSIAKEAGIAIIAGGYEPSADHRPYNTVIAVNSDGELLGQYRKLHLYDAYNFKESNKIMPGDNPVLIVQIGELRVGLMSSYDLRFPEMARVLAVEGADLIAMPATWFQGEHKLDHWESLLRARAVENTVWIAAAGVAGESTIGDSVIMDPLGVPVIFLDDEDGEIASADITQERIQQVRSFLPVLENRRFPFPAQ